VASFADKGQIGLKFETDNVARLELEVFTHHFPVSQFHLADVGGVPHCNWEPITVISAKIKEI
jgi:hypothetical protein